MSLNKTEHTHEERQSQAADGHRGESQFTHSKPTSETKTKKAVLTCSHWVRYCHSDKSHYGSPFLLTCGGGRNRAVSPKNQMVEQLADCRGEIRTWGQEPGVQIAKLKLRIPYSSHPILKYLFFFQGGEKNEDWGGFGAVHTGVFLFQTAGVPLSLAYAVIILPWTDEMLEHPRTVHPSLTLTHHKLQSPASFYFTQVGFCCLINTVGRPLTLDTAAGS